MKGDKKVLDVLSLNLSEELTAINQYFLHAELCGNWGYQKLYKIIKKEAVSEMKHAEELIERILFLEGVPDMSKYMKIRIGKTVPDMFKNDLALETEAIKNYNDGIEVCRKAGDNGSAELLKQMLIDEEEHHDWISMQLEQIDQIGLDNYLAAHLVPEDGLKNQ